MGDDLKSAYELALQRLARQAKAQGEAGPSRPLAKGQKRAIAAIRQEYRAKLAEREILYQSRRREAAGDAEALERLEEDYRRDRDHLESRREVRIRAVRKGEKL